MLAQQSRVVVGMNRNATGARECALDVLTDVINHNKIMFVYIQITLAETIGLSYTKNVGCCLMDMESIKR